MHSFDISNETLSAARRRVFTLEADGKRYYVKKCVSPRARYARALQRMAYRVSGHVLLAPTVVEDGVGALRREARKLKMLRERGLKVPQVVYEHPRYLVLEDVGAVLHKQVGDFPRKADFLVGEAAAAMARLHRAGFAHGGAQLKNFTLKNGSVYVIDFEEHVESLPLEDVCLRDVLIFLAYLGRLPVRTDLVGALRRYERERGEKVAKRLVNALRGLRWVRLFNSPFFRRFSLRDVKAFANLVACSEEFDGMSSGGGGYFSDNSASR